MGDELRFEGRVAIVTGAGSGLGRAYAELLAARGAVVIVADLSPAGDDVVAGIERTGGSALAVTADVSDGEAAAGIVTAALERFGRIDIVINNAGIIRRGPFVDFTAQDFLDLHAVHVMG